MKKKIAILSAFVMCTFNISNVINYKINNIEEINKNLAKQNIKFKSENYFEPNIEDIITAQNTKFNDSVIEFWFVPFAMKKKLTIGYNAWTDYFSPMMQKLDEYIFKNKVTTNIAGQIKNGLVNLFANVIKDNFTIGGNDSDTNPPYWDGYKQAASYIIKNKDYLNIFFRNKEKDSFFETEYTTYDYFFDKEQFEAFNVEVSENILLSEFKKFNLPIWFPILKEEMWDMEQDLFEDEKTLILVDILNDKNIVEFTFGDKTIKNLEKSLIKYSLIDKIPYYSGLLALSFCSILKEKILKNFKIDETIAMQFATYIYKFRNEIRTWKVLKTAYIEEDFYWFEKDMETAYEKMGSSFEPFTVFSEWPI